MGGKLFNLKSNVSVQRYGYGHFLVTVMYYRERYRCVSANEKAYDRLRQPLPDRVPYNGLTYSKALEMFADECLEANGVKRIKKAQ